MTDPEDVAASPVAEYWDDLLADAAATAEQYREEGWETLQLHPGDVTPLSGEYGDRVGLDVLVPDDEYERLEGWFDEGLAVDGYEVYRSTIAGHVFLVVVLKDEDADRAVLVPAYYALGDPGTAVLFEKVADAGVLHTYVRRLSGEFVEFRHDDPELLAPPEDADLEPPPDVDSMVEELADDPTDGEPTQDDPTDGEASKDDPTDGEASKDDPAGDATDDRDDPGSGDPQ